MIPEYQFDHVIIEFTDNILTEERLVQSYIKCMNFLRLKQRPDLGLTVLISPKWMFIGIITAPYTHATSGEPIYLDGFAYAGLVNIQSVTSVWPASAGLENDFQTVTEAIHTSTATPNVVEEEEEENVLNDQQ